MRSASRATGVAGWKHWDATAFVASLVPLLVLFFFHNDIAPSEVNVLLLIGSLVTYATGALFSRRQGDGRLAAAGGLVLVLAIVIASPWILLLVACLTGNCI